MIPPKRLQSSASAYERLLANEELLLVNPVLAQAIGLEASLLLKQLAYWLQQNEQKQRQQLFQDGRWWSFNSYEQWREENFPFLSISSIRRLFAQLEALGLVLSTQKHNPSPMLNSKWYSIDIEAYNAFMALWEALGRPWANASKAESKAAYARFLEDWEAAKTDLKQLENRLSIASQNAPSIPQNPADGVQAEDFARTEEETEAFIPPYWAHPAASSPHDLGKRAGILPAQALSEDFLPHPPEILDSATLGPLAFLPGNRSEDREMPSHALLPQPETLDAAAAHFGQGAETSAPRPFESANALIAPQPSFAEQDLLAELTVSDAPLPAEPRASQTEQAASQSEQADAQLEQSICPERADHLLKLNSPIKESIQEISKENQKEIQEQEQKTIASLCEAYVPARLVKDSLILETITTNASSEKANNGVGQNNPAASPERDAAQVKNDTETLEAKILSHDTASAPQRQESGFAPAASRKNASATSGAKSSNAAPQAANHRPTPPLAAPTKPGTAAQPPAAKAKAAAQSEPSVCGKAANPAQRPFAKPKTVAQSQASAHGQAANIATKPAANSEDAAPSSASRGGKAANAMQKPKSQGKTAAASAQTAAGGKTGDAAQEGRLAAKRAEAKRLRTPGNAAPGAKPAAVPNLYAEVVRRVFSSPQELLKADSAFVWLWVGFFRGSLKDTIMKSHKSQQLSDSPMDPAGILGFSLWYRDRYKQATLPRNPETLRVRCEEFRALPSMEAWLEKGQQQLDALTQALAQGIAPAELTTLLPKPHLRAGDTGKAIDTSDMQDFDWKGFFERINEHES